jgi:hypothetical protein
MMPNQRLREAIVARGFTLATVAERVAVDPKTVERWIATDRLPHRTHRGAVASLVGIEETFLWPALLASDRSRHDAVHELVNLYPNRGAVPPKLWDSLIAGATAAVDALVFAGLFLTDGGPQLSEALMGRAGAGVRIRVLLGDPASEAVAIRGLEEGIGEGLAARIRISSTYLSETAGTDGVELRYHATTLYNSIYRFDDNMLVNAHAFGFPASQNPVLHLRRTPTGRLFDHYLQSFDKVWTTAVPQTREG